MDQNSYLGTQKIYFTMPLEYDGQKMMFDVTTSATLVTDWRELHKMYSGVFKKFVFQKERGDEDGYVHWQGRGSLHKPKRSGELLSQIAPHLPGHWSLTSTEVHKSAAQFNYAMKVDTRLEGPWTEQDAPPDPPPRTRMVMQMEAYHSANQFYSYQQYIMAQSKIYDPRYIDVILDLNGNIGKSAFCEYLEYLGNGLEVPPLRDMQDLVGFLMDQPRKKAPEFMSLLIDMPRGMKKDKMAEFYAGIEIIKNGKLFDKRYKGRQDRMERPRMFIFTNTLPIFQLLSMDRWRIILINDKTEQVEVLTAYEYIARYGPNKYLDKECE